MLYAIRDHEHVRELTIEADSMYAIDTYTKWMDGHARRNWRTSTGQPTKNVSILKALMLARDERRSLELPDVRFVHVRGHRGHRLNGWADERAVRASHHARDGRQQIWSSRQGRDPIDVRSDAPSGAQDKAKKSRRTA